MRRVNRLGRRVGIGVAWALAAGRLSLALATVAAARSPADLPAGWDDTPPPRAQPAEEPAQAAVAGRQMAPAEAWRAELQSATAVLVCATIVLAAVTAMLLARG